MPAFTLRHPLAFLTVLGLVAAAGCSKPETVATDGKQLTFNDFEAVAGWIPNTETISRERAHSGSYSVKVGPENEFGMGYRMVLEKIIDHRPHKIRVEGWGYMTDITSTANLGFQIFDEAAGKEIFGDGIPYADAVHTPGKWIKISKDIVLPNTVTGNQQLRVFLWRAGATTPAYIDDLRISEVE